MIWAIAGYVALQLVIGLVVSRKVATEDDYLLAGRRLGYGMVSFSVFATWFGAETCVGAAGAIYAGGLSESSADPFGYALCLLLMGALFATALWRRKLVTIVDLLRERFSPGTERLAACLMVPTSVLWAAAQIRAFGQLIGATGGISSEVAIVVAASVAVVYTGFGGLLADVVTDLVQGLVLVAGLVVLGAIVLADVGGPAAALSQVEAARLELLPKNRSLLATLEAWAVPVIGSLFAQELCARVLASRSESVARTGTLIGGVMYLAVGSIPVLIGLLGPALAPDLADPEHVLVAVATDKLGPILSVLFVGALVSAILSTVDSTLLVASSLASHNLVVPLLPGITDRRKLGLARIGVIVCGAVACALALAGESVYSLVEQASAFGSAGISVSIVLGLAGSFGGARAAGLSIATGALVYALGAYLLDWQTPFVASLGAAIVAYLVGASGERFGRWGAKHAE